MRTKYKKKLKNGKEYFFYRLRHENLERPKDIYGKTIKELEKKIKKTNELLNNSINIKKETFGEVFENWLYNVKFVKIKNTSKEVYIKAYNNHIKNKTITKIKLIDTNREKVQKFYNQLAEQKIGQSIFKIVNLLIKSFIKFAYNNDMIMKDFSGALITPKESQVKKIKKIHAMTKKQQKIFIENIKGNRFELIFLLALYTGMRQTEIIALTWEDINEETYTIEINKIAKYQKIIEGEQKGTYQILVQTPKTQNSIRKINFPKELKEKLKQHKKQQKEYKLLSGGQYNEKNLIFCNGLNNYYSGSIIYHEFKKNIK